jgi:hypothetical protein
MTAEVSLRVVVPRGFLGIVSHALVKEWRYIPNREGFSSSSPPCKFAMNSMLGEVQAYLILLHHLRLFRGWDG